MGRALVPVARIPLGSAAIGPAPGEPLGPHDRVLPYAHLVYQGLHIAGAAFELGQASGVQESQHNFFFRDRAYGARCTAQGRHGECFLFNIQPGPPGQVQRGVARRCTRQRIGERAAACIGVDQNQRRGNAQCLQITLHVVCYAHQLVRRAGEANAIGNGWCSLGLDRRGARRTQPQQAHARAGCKLYQINQTVSLCTGRSV